jgi:hypothetical protein
LTEQRFMSLQKKPSLQRSSSSWQSGALTHPPSSKLQMPRVHSRVSQKLPRGWQVSAAHFSPATQSMSSVSGVQESAETQLSVPGWHTPRRH